MRETLAVERSARPTMISAKYRLKEERRRMLKLSVNKLRRIEDPESALRRSVLINNTVRRLQREQREARNAPCAEPPLFDPVGPLREDEPAITTVLPVPTLSAVTEATPNQVLEELEDVLSQFYMPPTPRMLTSIDEDEAREADDDAAGRRGTSPPRGLGGSPAKRPRLERQDADDEGRALADPTNTLEDFKDEVYLRAKPRVPLSSAPCANSPSACEDLRVDFCGRRFTHTGHDRENIAPYFGVPDAPLAIGPQGLGLGGLGAVSGAAVAGAAAAAAAAAAAGVSLQLQHSLQPYSCSQAHGQAQATLQAGIQHGLGFHSLMATMES